MKLIFTFRDRNSISLRTCGGKGFNSFKLKELLHEEDIVPDFFCITSLYSKQIFEQYNPQRIYDLLKEGRRTEAEELSLRVKKGIRKNVSNDSTLKRELKQTFSSFLRIEEGIVVRSSATVEDLEKLTCPGQFNSVLGITDFDSCIKAIAEVLCSAFSLRFFHYSKNTEKEVPLMAIMIQKILDADLSGVLYTKTPIETTTLGNEEKTFYVEMIRGMPEPLLSGSVTPTCFFVGTENKEIRVYQEGHQDYCLRWRNRKLIKIKSGFGPLSKISPDFVFSLVGIGNRIRSFFNKDQDIEWLSKNGKIYILQARPVGV